MLDMAFQLLDVLHPHVQARAGRRAGPAPHAAAAAGDQHQRGPEGGQSDASNTNPLKGLNTLLITAIANNNGDIRQLAVGETTMSNSLGALGPEAVGQLLGDEGSGFDQVIIQVDSRLPLRSADASDRRLHAAKAAQRRAALEAQFRGTAAGTHDRGSMVTGSNAIRTLDRVRAAATAPWAACG